MTNDYVVRAFDPADTDRLLEIWLAASKIGHPFLGDAVLRDQMKLVRDIYLPQAETWVACKTHRAIGFIGLLDNFIGGLFVDPSFHGHGIAKTLINAASSRYPSLDVDVYEDNPIAPTVYQRLGFREISRRLTDDDGRPHPLIRMRLSP
ncbi:GNAT family N-acetyltransferase [Aestuariispira ectoiniformans]|uniref:GNAT family N-acetyltransferase n=1 Tax=Aestuariispira ectoiniformans TaxID=2775080 RepID=UPI00223B720D|nr:GNAT family N-acetyltransferase [Aestuariispira ectoiniformans]